MPMNKLYHTLRKNIEELRPGERKTRLRNFTWLMFGLFESRSVHLSRIASKMPALAKLTSSTRRIQRLLCNPAIEVRTWYEPTAKRVASVFAGKEIRLIVDGSKVGFGHQLLMVAIGYRSRAIPLAWIWLKYKRGHSSAKKQIKLLRYVKSLIPAKTKVILAADTEFGAVEVLKQLEKWDWKYVIRQTAQSVVKIKDDSSPQKLSTLIQKPGQQIWFKNVQFTTSHLFPVNLVIDWQVGEEEPWFLITNLDNRQTALKYYRKRMWIEEMFGDMKRNGFDLESTHLRDAERLSRLTLAIVLLYVWLLVYGSRIIKSGKRHLVDRRERRDLSLFRIGWYMVERHLTNQQLFHLSLKFYL